MEVIKFASNKAIVKQLLWTAACFRKASPRACAAWMSTAINSSSENSKARVPTSSQTLLPGVKVEIFEDKETTYVNSVLVPTGRENMVVKTPDTTSNEHSCALCRLNLVGLHYTDVLILEQFLAPNGNLVTYHESKLCQKQYMLIRRLVKHAQRCNLIRRPADYFVPGPWHNLNTYIEPDRRRDQPMRVVKPQYWK